jgi:hypothetical protein
MLVNIDTLIQRVAHERVGVISSDAMPEQDEDLKQREPHEVEAECGGVDFTNALGA